MQLEQQIADFLDGELFAVAGASTNRDKYGNKVLRCLLQNNRVAVPINPNADEVEGQPVVARLADVEPQPHAVCIITPPEITEDIVDDAIALGIRHIWMQPGAESDAAINKCKRAAVNIIHSGPCILVVLGFRDR